MNSETMNGTIRSMLGTMLQHLSALPVQMLRQVYSLAVLKVPFGSLGSSRSLLASVGSALELCETNLNDFSA